VLEGSVRRAENRVRIIVRLVDATTGNLQWSERYDRPVADLFTVQDEIVQKIVTTLKLQFIVRKQTGTMGEMVSKPTDHLEAYDTFLRGLAYYWRLTKEDNLEARQLFERALILDPQYAAAHEFLGATYVMEWNWRWNPDPQNLERAFVLAQQAIALDDSSPGAHLILSEVYLGKKQLDRALAENERAIALEPNHADSYAQRANALIFTGRPAEAVPAAEQAVLLNPHAAYHLFELGWAYLMTGQEAQSMVALKRAITRNPDHVMAYVVLAFNYVSQWVCQLSQDPRILVQAREAAQHALALHDSLPAAHSALGFVFLWQKQYDQAIAELERGVALDASFGCGAGLLAGGLSMVGRIDEAVQVGEKALRLEAIPPDDCLLLAGGAYARAGRLEEAQILLRRFLGRYPHKLPAHLELAGAYSELGRDAEARAAIVEVLRINPQFSLEVYKQRVPIKDPAILERHIAALRKAGLK
jgi:tetratricopeptide (TPR) repeat protein